MDKLRSILAKFKLPKAKTGVSGGKKISPYIWAIPVIVITLLGIGAVVVAVKNAAERAASNVAKGISNLNPLKALTPDAIPTCPPGWQSNDAAGMTALCGKCPAGMTWDKAGSCYKPCPQGWKGGETLAHCSHHMIPSSAGGNLAQSGVSKCTQPGYTAHDGLCYKLPGPEWMYISPGLLGTKCPPAPGKDLVITPKLCTYGNTAGIAPQSCPADRELYGGRCYKGKCSALGGRRTAACTCDFGPYGGVESDIGYVGPLKQGEQCLKYNREKGGAWHKTAAITCQRGGVVTSCEAYGDSIAPTCAPGMIQRGALCYPAPANGYVCPTGVICSHTRDTLSQTGQLPMGCTDSSRERHGRLCYPKCPSGYKRHAGNLENCESVCPPGFPDIGIGGCAKAYAKATVEGVAAVGQCPPGMTLKALGCFKD